MPNTKKQDSNKGGSRGDNGKANAGDKGGSNKTSNRGFASMDPERQKEIASEGGKAAHASGNAHEFDSNEAREAGRKGGEAVSRDREHMAEIGQKGGEARNNSRDSNSGSGKRKIRVGMGNNNKAT